jgi:hypothetical protein
MRRFMPSIIWFVGGVILGQLAESVLTPLWMKLGLLLPVGRWLDSFGIKSLDWYWLVVDIWLVSWVIAALVSIIGGLYIRHQFLRRMVLFGVGFAFVPLAVHSYLYSHVPTFADYWQHAIIFAIILVSGFVSHRWNRTMPPNTALEATADKASGLPKSDGSAKSQAGGASAFVR